MNPLRMGSQSQRSSVDRWCGKTTHSHPPEEEMELLGKKCKFVYALDNLFLSRVGRRHEPEGAVMAKGPVVESCADCDVPGYL